MTTISSITIPTTLSLSLPKPHTIFQIHVSIAGSLQSYQVSRRYSDFVDFEKNIVETTGIHPPKPLPPKTYLRAPDIEQRRIALEAYLQAILEHKSLRSSAVLKQFLEVPLPRETRVTHDFYDLVKEVRSELQLARRHLQTHSADSYIQIKKALGNAEKIFSELTGLEKEAQVSEAESRRRRDVCDELHRESLSLMTLAQNYRHSSQGLHSQQSSSSSAGESPFAPAKGSEGRRRLGPAKETESTLGKSNEQLLSGQTQIMQQQDDLLSSLLPILQRQKELGNIIGQELDEQNDMLDELGDSMDGLEAKLQRGGKQITKITGKT